MTGAAAGKCFAAAAAHVEPVRVPDVLDVCDAAARLRARTAGAYLAAWCFGAASMAFVQNDSVWPAGNDSLYHVRMAAMLPESGFVQSFPWLHWTIFRDAFVSHHHGFHVALAPFAWLGQRLAGEAAIGGKLFVIAAMGATAALLLTALRTLGVRHQWMWIGLLVVLPWQFWMRMAYVRAPALALPLLLLAVCMSLRRRYLGLGITAFVLTQVYLGSVILPLLALAALVAGVVVDRSARHGLRCGAAIVAGMVCGLVVHPYFPGNLLFLYTQLFQTGLGAPSEAGSEWRPFDAWILLKMSAPVAIVWCGCLIARLRSARQLTADELSLFVFQLALLVLTLKARRFIEYWPVFLLLSAASLARGADWTLRGAGGRTMAKWGLGTAIVVLGFSTLTIARSKSLPPRNAATALAAARWLARNSPAGSLVLTDDWDVFPACFYANRHNRYAVGLDPVFTQVRYPELWQRYRLITRGRLAARRPTLHVAARSDAVDYADVATHFGAQYVLVMGDHPALYRALCRRSDSFRRVYPPLEGDQNQPAAAVFEVKSPPERIESRASRGHGQRDTKGRAGQTIRHQLDPAAQRFGHASRPRQPDAGSLGACSVKQLEDAADVFGRNARSRVVHIDNDPFRLAPRNHAHRRAGWRVLHCVRQQLDPQRRHLVGVGADRQGAVAALDRHADTAAIELGLQLGNRRPNDRPDVEPHPRTFAGTGEVQQARHAAAQPPALAQNILRPSPRIVVHPSQVDDQLGRAVDARQRVADAVRYAGAQFADRGQSLAALLRGALPFLPQRLIGPLQLARVPQHADQRGEQRRDQYCFPARLPRQHVVIRLQQIGLLGQHVFLHVGDQPQCPLLPLVKRNQAGGALRGRLTQHVVGLGGQLRQFAPECYSIVSAHRAAVLQRGQIGAGAIQRAARFGNGARLQRANQWSGQLAHGTGQRRQVALPCIENGHLPQQRAELGQRLMMQPQDRRDDRDVEARQHDEVVIPADAAHRIASRRHAGRSALPVRSRRQETSLWPEYC